MEPLKRTISQPFPSCGQPRLFPGRKKQLLLLLLFLSAALPLKAQQTLRGYITDSLTGKPLAGAVAYFNATSIGTPANEAGYFELLLPEGLVSPLVISFLGYEKRVLQEPFPKHALQIRLKPTVNHLNSVVLEGKVPRRQKQFDHRLGMEQRNWLLLFEKLFLGMGRATEKTSIRNREVLEFSYDRQSTTVRVTAREPVIIENDHLQYRISYNLDSFQLQLDLREGHLIPVAYSVAGTSFFIDRLDLQRTGKRRHKKIRKRRREAYKGSSFHFMKALAEGELGKSGFRVYALDSLNHNQQEVHFPRVAEEGFTQVTPPPQFYVSYADQRSQIFAQQESFRIDEFGNIHPWNALKYEGYMAGMGMSLALPLNFEL